MRRPTQAWAWQRARVDALCGGARSDHNPPDTNLDTRDSVLLLQHPPTFTLGAGSTLDNVTFDLAAPPHPIHRTERGGEVTYHGPGQVGRSSCCCGRALCVLCMLCAVASTTHRTECGREVTYHGPGLMRCSWQPPQLQRRRCSVRKNVHVPPMCRAVCPATSLPHNTQHTQLVMYPILDLGRHTRDLHWYLRSLEEVVIRALGSVSGMQVRPLNSLQLMACSIGTNHVLWALYHLHFTVARMHNAHTHKTG